PAIGSSPTAELPEFSIDFAALQTVNKDALAWLYSPGTAIDYPVMQASDYNWYLRHLPDGTYNANGALFLDYNNPSNFSGRLNIIYGHNMNSGKMFGSLTEYKSQLYFEEHPYLYLYTAEQGNFTVELLYGCVVAAGEWRSRAFMYETNLDSLLSFAALNTTFKSDIAYTRQDRFVVLSTCSYEFDDARYIVVGVLRPQ
ncbi:MAG: class B sortase, partial [Oscillospiraceae bacterium]